MPKKIQLSATPTAETSAIIDTVTPAAINPDSMPLVLFAKCMMELITVLLQILRLFSLTSGVKVRADHFDNVKPS